MDGVELPNFAGIFTSCANFSQFEDFLLILAIYCEPMWIGFSETVQIRYVFFFSIYCIFLVYFGAIFCNLFYRK